MSVPRGFYETNDGCDFSSPAFIRGVLLEQAQYDAMSEAQKTDILSIPRWTLYGGPIATRQEADDWNTALSFWAFQNGKVWLAPESLCVVRADQIKWPADPSFQYTWVFEQTLPAKVTRQLVGNQYKWVYV